MQAGGVLVVAVAWAASAGLLRRNLLAGIRLPSTMSSDGAWVAAHRASRGLTTVAGTALVAGGVLVIVEPSHADGEAEWAAIAAVAAICVAGVQARQAARRWRKGHP